MDLYSTLLGLALAAAGVAWVGARSARLATRAERPAAAGRRLAERAAMGSIFLAALSFVYHLFTGHRPGTSAGMGMADLVLEHPAPLVTAAGAALTLWWLRRG